MKPLLHQPDHQHPRMSEFEDKSGPKVVPNRKALRKKKINVKYSKSPFGRLTRVKMGQASLYKLVAVHQKQADGRTVKLVIPRENWGGIS